MYPSLKFDNCDVTARYPVCVRCQPSQTGLVDTYGYYSSGESFSIADRSEVWLLELIGKGPSDAGAVWVARRCVRVRVSL
jgi:dipeptidase